MISKNIKYYRLKQGITKAELARKCGTTAMAITHYENGERVPNMDRLKALAQALDVKVSNFLEARNKNLVFKHGEFRKNSSLNKSQQEYIRESVEEYCSRFFTAIELLGEYVFPVPPEYHGIALSDDAEENAKELRKHLGLSTDGPIEDLIALLENKGILVCFLNIGNDNFSGMNGLVNNYPVIAVNADMSPERIRSTIVHELYHLMFKNEIGLSEKENEKMADAVSGAFLFPKIDVLRELGNKRKKISNDMTMVCREYGISMMLLVMRAKKNGVISESTAKDFFIKASKMGWRKKEPSHILEEKPTLFEQLVYRAVNEDEISIQRGAELLRVSYHDVAENCCFGAV